MDDTLECELNGACRAKAKVVEINSSLAKIHFAEANRFEWIHLASPRFSRIYRKLIKENLLDNMIDLKTYNPCLSAEIDDEVVIVDLIDPDNESESETSSNDDKSHEQSTRHSNGQRPKKHKCGPKCLRANHKINENNVDIEKYSAFERPLLVGWKRIVNNQIFYQTPCGIVRRSLESIDKYLKVTDSKLRIDCFNLDANIRVELPKECPPSGTVNVSDLIECNTFFHLSSFCHNKIELFQDISRGVEKIPIPVRGQKIALEFNYISGYNFDYIELEPEDNSSRTGCKCEDNCRDKSKCSCWRLTVENATQKRFDKRYMKDSQYMSIGYNHMRLQDDIDGIIIECGSKCNCCAEKCVNRVVKNGIQQQLEIFLTESKGWAVRAKNDIPKGTFISIYAGDVLEEVAADQRDTRYQFKLKNMRENTSQNRANHNDSIDDDSDDEPAAKMIRRDLDDVICNQIINYFPPMLNENAKNFPESEVPRLDEGKYMVDAIKNGNVSRFFNVC